MAFLLCVNKGQTMGEIDRGNLIKAAEMYPKCAIHFTSGFMEIDKPFGFQPDDWDGVTVVNFHYPDPIYNY